MKTALEDRPAAKKRSRVVAAASLYRRGFATAAGAGRVPWAVFIGFCALIVRLPFMFDPRPMISGDGVGYLDLAQRLLDGHGFGGLSRIRPPGYPLFLDLMHVFPGRTAMATVVVQHVLGVAFAAVLLLVMWHFFGRAAAIVAGLLAATSPQLVTLEHAVLPDFLLMVFVFLGVAALAQAVTAKARWTPWLIACGALFGIAIMLKPVAQVLVLVIPLVLALTVRNWRRVLRGTACAIAAGALLVVPWVIHNDVTYGTPVVSTIGGEALFWRAFDGLDRLPFVGNDPVTRLARARYAHDPLGKAGVWRLYDALRSRGYSAATIDTRLRSIAVKAILADPGGYLRSTAQNFQNYAQVADPTAVRDGAGGQLEASYKRVVAAAPAVVDPVASVSWRVLRWAKWPAAVWWVLSFCGLAGLLLLLPRFAARRPAFIAFLTTWLALGLVTALIGLPDPRYNAAGLPLLWVMGSAGLVLVTRAVWQAVVGRPHAASASGNGHDPSDSARRPEQ